MVGALGFSAEKVVALFLPETVVRGLVLPKEFKR
jgi:hypothetical protein